MPSSEVGEPRRSPGSNTKAKGAPSDNARREDSPRPRRRDRSRSPRPRKDRRASNKGSPSSGNSGSASPCNPTSPLPKLPNLGLVLTPAPEPLRPTDDVPKNSDMDKAPRVSMVPRFAKQITAALIIVTKNNQGEDNRAAYCLAALAGNPDGSARLIRLVPDIGHFWSDEALPQELKDIHNKPASALPYEPQWPFSPVVVGFEAGTLPDAVTGPHRMDDVVARKLEYVQPVEDLDDLYEQLGRIASDSLVDTWPEWAWATQKSLIPNSEVSSLSIFNGEITWVTWRSNASPLVNIIINGKEVRGVPYAAHRLHEDKGYAMLQWMQDLGSCLLLLGLSRTFHKAGCSTPQCPILLLRAFPPR